jgi:hypothetical protein
MENTTTTLELATVQIEKRIYDFSAPYALISVGSLFLILSFVYVIFLFRLAILKYLKYCNILICFGLRKPRNRVINRKPCALSSFELTDRTETTSSAVTLLVHNDLE